jgi:hypothetical protein
MGLSFSRSVADATAPSAFILKGSGGHELPVSNCTQVLRLLKLPGKQGIENEAQCHPMELISPEELFYLPDKWPMPAPANAVV